MLRGIWLVSGWMIRRSFSSLQNAGGDVWNGCDKGGGGVAEGRVKKKNECVMSFGDDRFDY